MKFTIPLLAALATATPLTPRANLPGLTAGQSEHARNIISKNQELKYGSQGCQIAITTALTESSMLMYANSGVPASLNYPHDKVGSDHDSVGLFQQRASIYKDVKCDMDAQCSTGLFFAEMVRIVPNWKTTRVADVCARVQRPKTPHYQEHVAQAKQICDAAGVKG